MSFMKLFVGVNPSSNPIVERDKLTPSTVTERDAVVSSNAPDPSLPSVDALLHELCNTLPSAAQLAEQLRVAQRTVATQAQLIELLLRDRVTSSSAPHDATLLAQWLQHQQSGSVQQQQPQPPPPPPQVPVLVAVSNEQLAGVVRDVLHAVASLVMANHGVELLWRFGEAAGDGVALSVVFFALKTTRTQPGELAELVQRVRSQTGGSGEVLVVTSRTLNKASPTAEQVALDDYVLENRHTMPAASSGSADVAAVLSGLPVVAMHHKQQAGEFVSALESELNRQAVAAVSEFVGARVAPSSTTKRREEGSADESRVVRRIAKAATQQ